MSATVTVEEHEAWLPLASVARYDTVDAPSGKVLPPNRVLDGVTPPPGQLSLYDAAENGTTAVHTCKSVL